jgi:hypothetical protein
MRARRDADALNIECKEGEMNGLRFAKPGVAATAACVALGAVLMYAIDAQAAPPVTKPMADTQRAAQTKALKSRSTAHDQAKKEGNKAPASASAPAAQ